MGQFGSKHGKRTQDFFVRSFSDGLHQEAAPTNLSTASLTRCMNMKYIITKAVTDENGASSNVIALKTRQGTEKINTTALGAAILAETYYVADSHYIVATASKVYEYNSSTGAFDEIGSISGVPTFTEFKGKLIIHDSGATKAWNGTTLETLNCLYEDELIGTGDGSDVDFSGTLDHPAVASTTLTITYTSGGLTKTITSTAGGALAGDVNAGGTNTITYATGAYDFKCAAAPDNTTPIYAQYEKSGGAPKSKAGFVRASRLYMWGDADNPSRLWYSGVNDEDAWDSSSDGGYLDCDPLDGTDLVGCVNFYSSILLVKEASVHRLDNFPGDNTFQIVPIMREIGALAYRTILNDGSVVTFLSKEGWLGLTSIDSYGDISKAHNLSKNFGSRTVQFGNQYAYSEYNQLDRQLWLTLYQDTTQFPIIHVINMDTGMQLSLYKFAFAHSSYKFANGEMLIGGSDGNLYRLLGDNSRYKDDGESYASDTYVRGVMTDWGAGNNRKHNKYLYPHIYGKAGTSATLNIYTDCDYTDAIYTKDITTSGGDCFIFDDGQDVLINDMDSIIGAEMQSERSAMISKKFNYREVMWELTDISGGLGVEVYGIDFNGAIIGR